MIQVIKAYLKFLYHSKNEHGVHSPFVFNLVTKCFYDKEKHQEYETISNYHFSLIDDDREILVTDFGSGSKVFKS
ncbi:MAG TPA: class I SAM-dependent methyltransferase, partial [Flavobacterium sp.]|nr:class I SAM-dependent methyltransferase [Flavobacterium sp.]